MRCAFCNRPMLQAAVFVGALPIGPQCARKAGLIGLARKKSGVLRLAAGCMPKLTQRGPKTLDLFEEVPAHG